VTSGPTLLVENGGGKPAARFNASSGPPLAVGNSNKIQNLNADRLDGIDSTSFVRGGGTIGRARASVQNGHSQQLLVLTDLASVVVQCTSGEPSVLIANPTSSTIDLYTRTAYDSLDPGFAHNIGSWEGLRLVQVGKTRFDGPSGVAHVATIALALHQGDPCRAQAQALQQPWVTWTEAQAQGARRAEAEGLPRDSPGPLPG
jgi:hypothetical protein